MNIRNAKDSLWSPWKQSNVYQETSVRILYWKVSFARGLKRVNMSVQSVENGVDENETETATNIQKNPR